MGFREVSVIEVREVLRAFLAGQGQRTIAGFAGVDRKTVRRYIQVAQSLGLQPGQSIEAITDELVGQVVDLIKPGKPINHGESWQALEQRHERLVAWVKGQDPDGIAPTGQGLTVTKIQELLAREGCPVAYRTLHRYVTQQCGYRRVEPTVRVADGQPGIELQVDFGYLGRINDQVSGRIRRVNALVFTAVYSRHMFVYLTHQQTLEATISGCNQAWEFFGGVFACLIPDNMSPIIKQADRLHPSFTVGWLDYSQHCGFATDPARLRSPQDKPRVERAIQYVQKSMWAGENFTSLTQAQEHATAWCLKVGHRVHGTTQAKPIEVFTNEELPLLYPVPRPYDQPIFGEVKVHRDLHVQIAKALYSAPGHLRGRILQARADSHLVKLYWHGQLVRTHPRMAPGKRSTNPEDIPEGKAVYANRDFAYLLNKAEQVGPATGQYVQRLFDQPMPWNAMRSVYSLLSVVDKYGPSPVEAACQRALDFDVIDVRKIKSMVEQALESAPLDLPDPVRQGGRFARPAHQYAIQGSLALPMDEPTL